MPVIVLFLLAILLGESHNSMMLLQSKLTVIELNSDKVIASVDAESVQESRVLTPMSNIFDHFPKLKHPNSHDTLRRFGNDLFHYYYITNKRSREKNDATPLWKVDISLEEQNEKFKLVNTKINVNIKEELGGVELLPLSKISKHFSSPADEHTHIIIQRPVETKEFHMGVGCISWANNLVSFEDETSNLFTFPDGTEDEHIVINRIQSSPPNCCDTSQQPFSS
ncbi:unnamed protein product [Rhizophagus irregularis]|nr:unnamed protein product [Rhizophagus irregularis]